MKLLQFSFLCLLILTASRLEDVEANSSDKSASNLPEYLDYEKYLEKYHKNHNIGTFASFKLQLFLGRTLKVFLHNVNYYKGEHRYFLTQNQFTDMTAVELDNFRGKDYGLKSVYNNNPELQDGFTRSTIKDMQQFDTMQDQDSSLNFMSNQIVDEPKSLIDMLKNNPIQISKISTLLAPKSDTSPLTDQPKVAIEHIEDVQSDNKDYVPPELPSMGFLEDLGAYAKNFKPLLPDLEFDFNTYDLKNRRDYDLAETVTPEFKMPEKINAAPKQPKTLDYNVDWRLSGCIPKAKSQNTCNACYVFATLDLMEYYYCRQMKKSTGFSAQYIIDCGSKVGMNGCDGGRLSQVGLFIKRFGIELESKYPYLSMKNECPATLDDNDDSKTGYLRPNITSWQRINSVEEWFKMLMKGPIIVGINLPPDFFAYGGGIHEGNFCVSSMTHAMLLVGYGSEDGVEFWLIKNSFSNSWGEDGYIRLSKYASSDCFNSAIVARVNFGPGLAKV